MTYQPLARKYRPKSFFELMGQEAVAKALSGAIHLGRIPQAIIFSGVRGIGKTTTARLFAKSLNCENGPTDTPCGVCISCKAITIGVHEDVIEIDGASHNGVDEVRALQETIQYIPQRSKYKVYLIDEVHMLSTSAFNALLKTLEEPPPHVVFIFATTELHKLPQTVVGRCQTFYLRKLSNDDIVKRMTSILHEEGIPFETSALMMVAKEGRGSMRDALTYLDQLIAIGGGKVTLEALRSMNQDAALSQYFDLLQAIVEKDAPTILRKVSDFDQGGCEFVKLVEQLAILARHGMIIDKLGDEAPGLENLELTPDERQQLRSSVQNAQPFDLHRIFRLLASCRLQVDGSELDRFVFENYLMEWCFDPGIPTIDELLSGKELPKSLKVQQSSNKEPQARGSSEGSKLSLQGLRESLTTPPKKSDAEIVQPALDVKEEIEATQKSMEVGVFPESWRQLVDGWKREKPLQARKLEEVHPIEYSIDKIVVAVDSESLIGASLLDPSQQQQMTQLFRELFGFRGVFRAVVKPSVDENAQPSGSVASDAQQKRAFAVAEISPSKMQTAGTGAQAPVDEAAGVKPQPLPESILQEKQREVDVARQNLTQELMNHPITQSVGAVLGGSMTSFEITDPSLA